MSKTKHPREGTIRVVVVYFDDANPERVLRGARFEFPLGTTRLEAFRIIREEGERLRAIWLKQQQQRLLREQREAQGRAINDTSYSNINPGDEANL